MLIIVVVANVNYVILNVNRQGLYMYLTLVRNSPDFDGGLSASQLPFIVAPVTSATFDPTIERLIEVTR